MTPNAGFIYRMIKAPFLVLRRAFWWLRNNEVSYPHEFLLLFAAMPVALTLRLLSPFLTIRVARITASRLGNLSFEPEGYVMSRDLGLMDPNTFDIFYYTKAHSNKFLAAKWRSVIRVWGFARYVYIVNPLFPGSERFRADTYNLREMLKCHSEQFSKPGYLRMSPREERRAEALLKKYGILPNREFVCFFNRDSVYLDTHVQNSDWSYHSYRDSEIENYRAAIDALSDKGYGAFRMGACVSKEFKSDNPHVIDYPSRFRAEINDDILDVYLLSKAKFIIAATCGLADLCQSLRKDNVFVNAVPFILLDGFAGKIDMFIPKLFWLKNEQRYMTFREILGSPAKDFGRTEDFAKAGIEPRENTSDEIHDVALEMDQRISGTWQETPEDRELQETFMRLLPPNRLPGMRMPRIGAAFLRKHRNLLS